MHHDPTRSRPLLVSCLDGKAELPVAPPWNQWLSVAGHSRPLPGYDRSGDAWLLHWTDLSLTVAVVDGLGHGALASDAAAAALRSLQDVLSRDGAAPLDELMRSCHRALCGGRGAAVALLRLDLRRRRESFCGIGNVTFLGRPQRSERGVSLPGIVGHTMRTARVFEVPSEVADLLVLHTDGIRSSFTIPGTESLPESVVTAARAWGRDGDDQALVAVRILALPPLLGG